MNSTSKGCNRKWKMFPLTVGLPLDPIYIKRSNWFILEHLFGFFLVCFVYMYKLSQPCELYLALSDIESATPMIVHRRCMQWGSGLFYLFILEKLCLNYTRCTYLYIWIRYLHDLVTWIRMCVHFEKKKWIYNDLKVQSWQIFQSVKISVCNGQLTSTDCILSPFFHPCTLALSSEVWLGQ